MSFLNKQSLPTLTFACIILVCVGWAGEASAQTAAPQSSQSSSTASSPLTPVTSVDLRRPLDQITSEQIEGMRKRLLDWPQLARYEEDNEKVGPPKPGEKRVVFYGDSITDAWPSRGHIFSSQKSFVGRGISGQTTPQMLVRFRQDVLDLHPAVVVILAGINDIAGNTGPQPDEAIQDNFRSMVALAKAKDVRVVLCSILPAKLFPWNPGVDPRPRVKQLNTWLKDFATEQHLIYVDYFSAMVDSEGGLRADLGADAVHPNTAGYAIMEPLVEAGIAKALKQHR